MSTNAGNGLVVAVALYLAVGAGLYATATVASPCASSIWTSFSWGKLLLTQVLSGEMTFKDFLLSAYCEDARIRSAEQRPPARERVFQLAAGDTCPEGTEPNQTGGCTIPDRTGLYETGPCDSVNLSAGQVTCAYRNRLNPLNLPARFEEPSIAVNGVANRVSCPKGFIAAPRYLGLVCTRPSIAKVVGKPCPKGFAPWVPDDPRAEPKTEVCVRA